MNVTTQKNLTTLSLRSWKGNIFFNFTEKPIMALTGTKRFLKLYGRIKVQQEALGKVISIAILECTFSGRNPFKEN